VRAAPVRAAIVVAAMLAPAGPSTATASDEAELQAAFVSKLPEFVEWPSAALDGRTNLVFCVTRQSPLAPHLKAMTSGSSLNGRPYAVHEIDPHGPVVDCHVLFVGRGESGLLRVAARLPILTVGDDPAFLDRGGMIRLQTVERRLRFEVALPPAQRVDLRFSSQLLGLATRVRRGRS
jgi:hypothetical protein